jgi:peptidoglycan hydrolase CwlO-like protein
MKKVLILAALVLTATAANAQLGKVEGYVNKQTKSIEKDVKKVEGKIEEGEAKSTQSQQDYKDAKAAATETMEGAKTTDSGNGIVDGVTETAKGLLSEENNAKYGKYIDMGGQAYVVIKDVVVKAKAKKELEETEAEVVETEKSIENSNAKITDLDAKIEQGKADGKLSQEEYDAKKAQLAAYKAQLDGAQEKFDATKGSLNDAKKSVE